MFVGTRGTEKPQCQRSSMLTKRTHAGEPKSFPSQNIQKPEVNGEKRDIRFFKLLHINRAGLSVTNKTNKQKKRRLYGMHQFLCAFAIPEILFYYV